MRRRHDLIAVQGPRQPAPVPAAGDPTARSAAGDRTGPVAPETFRWRGRRYVVTEVLAHWVEAVAWWRPGGPVPDVEAGPVRQRQWWRVAARPTHPATQGVSGVYELCCSGGSWSLRRVHD